MWLCTKFMYTITYSNIERFDIVIAQIKWCSFLPYSVVFSHQISLRREVAEFVAMPLFTL